MSRKYDLNEQIGFDSSYDTQIAAVLARMAADSDSTLWDVPPRSAELGLDTLAVQTIYRCTSYNKRPGMVAYACICGREYHNTYAYVRHAKKCATHKEGAAEMEAVVPTHPSNRTFIRTLEAWGCEVVKRRSERVTFKFPDDSKMTVMSETHHKGNPSDAFIDAAARLDVSLPEFWAGPVTDPDDKSTEPKPDEGPIRRRHKGYVNKVLDTLVQAGCPMSIDRIAEEVGITRAQASSAASRLVILTAAERIKSGVYVAAQYAQDYRVGVDVTVGTREPQETPQEAPERPSKPAPVPDPQPTPADAPADDDAAMEQLIEDFLDMIFPQGFKARHLKAIADWQDATKRLFREVQGG